MRGNGVFSVMAHQQQDGEDAYSGLPVQRHFTTAPGHHSTLATSTEDLGNPTSLQNLPSNESIRI